MSCSRKGRLIEVQLAALMIVVSICVIIGCLVVQLQRCNRHDDVYQQVARNHEGRCHAGGLLGWPSIHFTRRGVRVLLDIYSTGGENRRLYTQLHLSLPDKELRMEVFPEGFGAALGKFLGTQDIVIGSPEFDRDYIIRGNDEQRIASILTVPVQIGINALRRLLGNDDIYVAAKAGTLLIKKREFIRRVDTLEQFLTLGLDLYDEMTGAGAEGVEFVDRPVSSFALDTPDGVCQICGEAITADRVCCRSCKTPHHQECWVYYGKCSTYGCGENRYVRPRQ